MKLDLLREARDVIAAIPDNVIDLDAVVSKADPTSGCGTICCAAGWLGLHPKFQALGLGVSFNQGDPWWTSMMTLNGAPVAGSVYSSAMAEFFDIPVDDAFDLFGGRGDDESPLTDKQVWLERADAYLAKHAGA